MTGIETVKTKMQEVVDTINGFVSLWCHRGFAGVLLESRLQSSPLALSLTSQIQAGFLCDRGNGGLVPAFGSGVVELESGPTGWQCVRTRNWPHRASRLVAGCEQRAVQGGEPRRASDHIGAFQLVEPIVQLALDVRTRAWVFGVTDAIGPAKGHGHSRVKTPLTPRRIEKLNWFDQVCEALKVPAINRLVRSAPCSIIGEIGIVWWCPAERGSRSLASSVT